MHTMLDNIFTSISEAVENYDFPKAYKLVQHDISYWLNHRLLANASCRPFTITEVT